LAQLTALRAAHLFEAALTPPTTGGEAMRDNEEYRRTIFAKPSGTSALRAASRNNPRVHPCPTCKQPNRLTPKDVRLGYQCDSCADAEEG
jgi:hypothetical protein